MSASHHFFPRFFARLVESIQRRRRRRIGERMMSELPPELQRDIGWKPPDRARR